jgi:hypothetical protein
MSKKTYKCDRRDLLKWFGAGAATMMMVDFDEMYAAGVCEKIEETGSLAGVISTAESDPKDLLYWFDGSFGKSMGSDIATRVRLAAHLDLEHSAASYVESVILADTSNAIIAAQRFEPGDATSKGRAPYAIFEGLDLAAGVDYFLFWVVKAGASSVVHKFVISKDNVRISRMDYSHLSPSAKVAIPQLLINDLGGAASEHSFKDGSPAGAGYITTPYQQYAQINLHRARAVMQSISGDSFGFKVFTMHGDADPVGHYMRYFLVLDPVGRVLGGIRRRAGSLGVAISDISVNAGLFEVDADGAGNKTAVDQALIAKFSILDCPYVQIVTEDKRDACARSVIRLR